MELLDCKRETLLQLKKVNELLTQGIPRCCQSQYHALMLLIRSQLDYGYDVSGLGGRCSVLEERRPPMSQLCVVVPAGTSFQLEPIYVRSCQLAFSQLTLADVFTVEQADANLSSTPLLWIYPQKKIYTCYAAFATNDTARLRRRSRCFLGVRYFGLAARWCMGA